MKRISIYITVITISILSVGAACTKITESNPQLTETLLPVEAVTLVEGAENTSITVHKNTDAYFNIVFSNIDLNRVIENGSREGWCIDWLRPINSNGGTYDDIKLYSTYLVEKWLPVNYLFNIKDDLLQSYPDLTWQEIQLAIWSLRANPKFDLDEVAVIDLPAEMRIDDKPNFSYERVRDVLEAVEKGYRTFNFGKGTKFAVIVETPADIQTVITVVEKR